MRPALLALSIVLTSQAAWAATAYEALRTLGKQKGEAVLDSVMEVRGDNGAPQPKTWKIVAKDARGGTREYSVSGPRLAGEKAAGGGGAPMNMSQLNLDSDGAHTIAEREAKKASFAYDRASYSLRGGSKGGSPVWEIHLVDERSGSTATLDIAATNGNVLATEGLTARKAAAVSPTAPAAAPAPTPRPQPVVEERITQTARTTSHGTQHAGEEVGQFFERVGNHMSRRGRQIDDFFHNLFTGEHRDTAGPHGPRPGSNPPPPRRGDEDYVKPSRVRD